MKIKNPILAKMLASLGHKVTAELIIDDSNGTSLTFPEISDVTEIAIDVAVDAPDGTYVIADGERTITMVVVSGVVTSVDIADPSIEADNEIDAEVQAVLEAVVEANVQAKAENAANAKSIVALQNELKDLKVSLKHEGKEVPAPASQGKQPQFKVIG